MSTHIKLKIQVDELDNVLQTFNRIKVYRSIDGIEGTYTELTTSLTRVQLQQGKTLYEFDDAVGDATYYYRTSYFHEGTSAESNQSDPQKGSDTSLSNILTVQELKDIYLVGVDLTDQNKVPFPNVMFEHYIRWAIGLVERSLDLFVRPTAFVERYDYYRNDYQNWTYIRVRQSPLLKVNSVKVKWPSNTTVIEFPQEWIQVRLGDGQINIVPTSGTLSQVLLTAGGSFLPLMATGNDFVPDILEVDYVCGFAEGKLPPEIKELIGMLAAFGPLNTAGDLVAGPGISSKSISIDGLSQSINTNAGGGNSGYGARLKMYQTMIKETLPVLRRYYKGIGSIALG